MSMLASLEMNEVLIEAGATLNGALLGARLVDELLLYVAPTLLGPHAKPLALLPQLDRMEERSAFAVVENSVIGGDLRIRLRPAAAGIVGA